MTDAEITSLSYNLDQAAVATGLSRSSLYRAVKAGELPAKRSSLTNDGRPAGRVLILRRELELFLENLPDDWWGMRA